MPRTSDEYLSSASNHNTSSSSNKISTKTKNKIGGFPYPECWNDDQCMDMFMGPFRLRSLNPKNYDAQMQFWQDLIGLYCEFNCSTSFNKRQLQLTFMRQDQVPYGLDNVLEEMKRTKQIRVRTDYEYDPANSWTGWAINSFIKRPLNWGYSKIPIIGLGTQDAATLEYVHVDTVKKFCRDLQTKVLQPHAGELLHFEVLKQLADEVLQLSDDSIHLCLHTLHCQKLIGLEYAVHNNEKSIHLVKIPSKTDASVDITETNRAVHNLQMTQTNLLKQLDQIEYDIRLNERKALMHVQAGQRPMAKIYLRKKQLLEKNRDKRSIALHNVDTLLCSVEEAQSSGEILDAFKIGSKALQNLLNDSGLKYDNVDEIISDVRETIEAHNEVQDTLANVNVANNNYNDDSLERELKGILGESDADVQTATTPKSQPKTAKVETATVLSNADVLNQNNSKTIIKTVEITDEELLAMLEGLDVEESSPAKPREITQCSIANEQL